MSSREKPKQALFEQLAVIARALGSAARLELLDFLAQGERNVEELAEAASLSLANTSKHLQHLKAAGLVEARRDGKHIRYRFSDDRLLDAVRALRILAEAHLSAVEELVTRAEQELYGLEGHRSSDPAEVRQLWKRIRHGMKHREMTVDL